ncbi:polysaccharide pyruvyl transferase family protein [Sphingosinicella humi]|nr:polysaccharide pyruvyl transferase family protein [Sphingosinicella humi]
MAAHWLEIMPRRRKIGVLTFHRCINYGSYWQARCLVEGLRARGDDAVLLDHDSAKVNRAEWRCALRPLLPERTSRSDYRLYALKTRRFLGAFDALPRSARFRLDDPQGLERYDVVIVGSDEVWNLRHPWYGGRPLFYGAGLNVERLVSYAASFGNHDAADGLDGWWTALLKRFSFISVRDENSRRMVRDALNREPELVLDPCLQFPPKVSPGQVQRRQPYIAVYGHSFPAWFTERVRRSAAAHGYKLLSIGYRNDWADEQLLTAGPERFAKLMAASAAIATNFFHGCVFALLYGRPFACATSPYRFNKVRDLADAVGAQKHVVAEDTPTSHFHRLLAEPLGPAVHERIAALRRQSASYLDHVLA